jgi:hypothetical protein
VNVVLKHAVKITLLLLLLLLCARSYLQSNDYKDGDSAKPCTLNDLNQGSEEYEARGCYVNPLDG